MKRIINRFFLLGEWSNSQILPGVFFYPYDPTEDWVPRCLAEQIKCCPWKCKCNDQNITVKILQMVFPELQWVFLLLLHVSAKNRKWKQSEKQCHIAMGCCCLSSSSLAFFNSFTLWRQRRKNRIILRAAWSCFLVSRLLLSFCCTMVAARRFCLLFPHSL